MTIFLTGVNKLPTYLRRKDEEETSQLYDCLTHLGEKKAN